MGDRVVIVVTAGEEMAEAAVYAHWLGMEAPSIIQEVGEAKLLRAGDPSYSLARICAAFCERQKGPLSVGIIAPPENLQDDTLADYSHGDGGVIVVNVGRTGDKEGSVAYHEGYEAEGAAGFPKTVKLYSH